jgi:hypothetical protein
LSDSISKLDLPMRTLLVFLKYPAAGLVKTRLGDALGVERAAALYRQWIDIVLAKVQPLRGSSRVVGCYDGADYDAFAPWHALADAWWPQPAAGLGERLDAAFRAWQADGNPAAAIGTDCLEFDVALVEQAFDLLRAHDAVFGPAHDGGYYLVGLARSLPGFFEGIPWSTAHTLAAHEALCRKKGWSFALLRPLADIDTLEDWHAYQRRQSERP